MDSAFPCKFQDFFLIWTLVSILDLGPLGSTGHIYSYVQYTLIEWPHGTDDSKIILESSAEIVIVKHKCFYDLMRPNGHR